MNCKYRFRPPETHLTKNDCRDEPDTELDLLGEGEHVVVLQNGDESIPRGRQVWELEV